ncbi:MAG: VTT domain-containing protein [Planctomycetota bacterium]
MSEPEDKQPAGQPDSAPEDPPESPSESEVRFRDFGRAGPAAIIAAFLPALGGFLLLALLGPVSGWLNQLGWIGVGVYVAIFALTSGLAILPTYAQAALGGYAFGLVGGVPAALAGFLGGSIVGYAVARRMAGDDANAAIDRHPKWAAVRDAFVSRTGFFKTLGIVTLVRVPPNSPFALTNLLMASVRVPRAVFLIGTAIGMLPRTAVVVWIGSQVAAQFAAAPEAGELTSGALREARPGWLLPVGIGLAVGVLVLLAWLGDRAIKKAIGSGQGAGGELPPT